jgi:hypothetical protein
MGSVMILITGDGGKTPSPGPLQAGEGEVVLTKNYHHRGEGRFAQPSIFSYQSFLDFQRL